jgi:cobalt/nickel transport system permease protein
LDTMTLPSAFPTNRTAPLSRIDPRWKLAALMPAAVCISTLRSLAAAALALGGALLLVVFARLPPRWYLTRLGLLIFFLGLFLLLLPLVDHDDAERWQCGPVLLSPRGTRLAVVLLLKAVAMVSLLLAAATTAALETHLKALHSLRVPGILVHLAALTLRYLAVLVDEFGRMRIALRLRGYRQRPTLRSLQVVANVSGMLLVRGHSRAERVGQALRCRGFDGQFRTLTRFATRPRDVLFFTMVLGTTIGLLLWDASAR